MHVSETQHRMDKFGKRKKQTVSITIQWCEEEPILKGKDARALLAPSAQPQLSPESTDADEVLHSHPTLRAQLHSKRLLPSDRVVLNSLRARILPGTQVTTLVRTRELEAECEISRRQVQICLKRLTERGIIRRIIEGRGVGSQEGYRYQISQDLLQD